MWIDDDILTRVFALAARPLVTSATSVVNINGPGTRVTGWHFGISECPRAHHRLPTINHSGGAFGNALGFNAPTALTTYLYSSTPFDAASGNYYDGARFYNAGIGMFDQADYGYSGTLTDPMTSLPYTFTGGDPVNMLDLNGHDFSIADTLPAESISDFLDTGLGYVNTVFKVYNSAQDILRVIQYAQFAVQVVQALAGAPTLTAAEDAVGAAITNAFPDFQISGLSAGFSAAYNVLAKDWEQISKAIAANIPEIAGKSALYATEMLPSWTVAYEEGRLRFVIFAPTGPERRSGNKLINIGSDLALSLSLGGGRLFGFGIEPKAGSLDQIFRVDYWENGQLWVHYHVQPNINGNGVSIWGTQP
jgi:RHS repeat-associated protein